MLDRWLLNSHLLVYLLALCLDQVNASHRGWFTTRGVDLEKSLKLSPLPFNEVPTKGKNSTQQFRVG